MNGELVDKYVYMLVVINVGPTIAKRANRWCSSYLLAPPYLDVSRDQRSPEPVRVERAKGRSSMNTWSRRDVHTSKKKKEEESPVVRDGGGGGVGSR